MVRISGAMTSRDRVRRIGMRRIYDKKIDTLVQDRW
jgi:hypothetical protein